MLPVNYLPSYIPIQKYLYINTVLTNNYYIYVDKNLIEQPIVKFNIDIFSKNVNTFYFCGQNFELRHNEVLNLHVENKNIKIKVYIIDNLDGRWRIQFLPFDNPPSQIYLTNLQVYEDIFRDEENHTTLPTDPPPPPTPPPPPPPPTPTHRGNGKKILVL